MFFSLLSLLFFGDCRWILKKSTLTKRNEYSTVVEKVLLSLRKVVEKGLVSLIYYIIFIKRELFHTVTEEGKK